MKSRRYSTSETNSEGTTAGVEADVYRTVVDDLTETICRILPDGTFTYVNEVYCRLFGMTKEMLVGQRWQPVVVPEDLPLVLEKLRELTPSNPVVVIENRIIDGSGHVRWMQFVNRGFFDSHGRLQQTQSVGRDITPLVNAELNLDDTRHRWLYALEGSGFGVWDWDIEAGNVYFSNEWKRLFGFHIHEEVQGGEMGWKSLVHPDDLPGVTLAISDHLKGRSASYSGELRMRCNDGSWKWVLARGRVMRRDVLGNACRMVGTTSDISARKAAEHREINNLQLIASGAPSEAVLYAIVRSIEAGAPTTRCTVMLADHDSGALRVVVAPSMPSYFKKALGALPISAQGGCCGLAAMKRESVVCADLFADPAMEPFHKLALKAKIRSCWSEPILSSDGTLLGTFACYHKEPRTPDRAQQNALSHAARLAAMAINREKQEAALTRSEERYARAIRATTDGLWEWNLLTGETYLSARWKEMLGFAESELPSNRQEAFLARLHPEDVARVDAARRAHFENDVPYDVEFRLRNKEGQYRWFLARGRAERNSDGRPVRMTGTISDITSRKDAELKYLGELAFNQALVRNTAAFIAVLDLQGRFVYANPSFFSTLGYREEDVIGKVPWEMDLMDADTVQRTRARFPRLLAGEEVAPMDVKLHTKQGEWRMGELRSTLIRTPDGAPDRVIVTGIDLTDRHHLQKQVLRIADQEQARLGHDLHDGVGQTMTGTVIMAEALEAMLEGEQKELAARILELLRESVAEVRRMSHGMSPTSVRYRGLVGALQLLAETVRTNFRTPCEADLDSAIAVDDPEKQTHLFRIAQEAVNNALRHGKPKQIRFSLKRLSSQECELRISNDGKSMKKTKSGSANGIGLQVMSYRAKLIGAHISVESGVRQGVTVICRFPSESDAGVAKPSKCK